MAPVYLHEGKVLIDDGAVAVNENCCCGDECSCLSEECSWFDDPKVTPETFSVTLDNVSTGGDQTEFCLNQQSSVCVWKSTGADGEEVILDLDVPELKVNDVDGNEVFYSDRLAYEVLDNGCALIEEAEEAECVYESTDEGPQELAIDGYYDNDADGDALIPASECGDDIIDEDGQPKWDGKEMLRSSECSWNTSEAEGLGGYEIDGKSLYSAEVTYWEDDEVWKCGVSGYDDTYSSVFIWDGDKTTGTDPMGTYGFEYGCAGPDDGGPNSIDIIEVTS